MILKRYSFPCRYSDMIPIFGRPVQELCMICNTVTDWIYAHHSHRITQWNRTISNPLELEKYAEAVFSKGVPLSNCFGFVDGTMRPITRPGENRRLLYNGRKRVHGLTFQSVVLRNGLIAHLYGPLGKANDYAYNKSSLKQLRKRRVRISWTFPLTALTLTPIGPFPLPSLRQQ